MDSHEQLRSVEMELESTNRRLSEVSAEIESLLNKQSGLQMKRKTLLARIKTIRESQSSASHWGSKGFSWSAELDEKMEEVFGVKDLRPLQLETMNTTLSNVDCLLIMPTGGGKSLCFQLPALLSVGLTLVISPLISLMEDQIMALKNMGIPAQMLCASTSKEVVKAVHQQMITAPCQLRLLYVTPEKISKSKMFMSKLEKCFKAGQLSRIAIDEVHCCSQWGHDFRPDYKTLGILKRQFPGCPILGLTATASTSVLADVQKMLQIPHAQVYRASFNRPNLNYTVKRKPVSSTEFTHELADLINNEYKSQSGIIYCISRKETETVSQELSVLGIKCAPYHADMNAQQRSQVHSHWLSGKLHVIIATTAFGMGIDKPNVRFVIHHSLSKSMENYYQESGRAGRDSLPADCILYFQLIDVFRQSIMAFTELTGLPKLYSMVEYCLNKSKCKRTLIASHFSEVWPNTSCNKMCDFCRGASALPDLPVDIIEQELSLVYEILDKASGKDSKLTATKVLDALIGKGPTGARASHISNLSRIQCELLLAHMVVNGHLVEEFTHTPYTTISYLSVGNRSRRLNLVGTHGEVSQELPKISKLKNSKPKKRKLESNSHPEVIELDSD